MVVVFRKAEQKDKEEILILYRKTILHMMNQNILQWDEIYPNEEVLYEDINRNEMYVLAQDDIIVAAIVLNEEQDEEYITGNWKYLSEKIGVIHRLCVHPDYQRCGYGKKLMILAEDLLQKKGYSIIRLDTFSENPKAISLYRGLGYIHAGEVMFRKGQFYLMEKHL